jgi:hypothetical protein
MSHMRRSIGPTRTLSYPMLLSIAGRNISDGGAVRRRLGGRSGVMPDVKWVSVVANRGGAQRGRRASQRCGPACPSQYGPFQACFIARTGRRFSRGWRAAPGYCSARPCAATALARARHYGRPSARSDRAQAWARGSRVGARGRRGLHGPSVLDENVRSGCAPPEALGLHGATRYQRST